MGNNKSKIKPETLIELTETTHFSNKDIIEFYKEFMKSHPSGFMDLEQYKKIYSKLFPYGDASKFCEHLFRNYDTNKDGKIEFKELIIGLSIKAHGSLEDKIQWAFSVYDLDGNGFITREEMQEILESFYKVLKNDLDNKEKAKLKTDEYFTIMDLNRDNKISYDEFVKGAQKDQSLVNFLNS